MLYSMIKSLSKSNNFSDDFYIKQLRELEHNVDWDDLVAEVFPHYVKSKISPISLTVENMLRICILMHHFNMSPTSIKKTLSKNKAFRDFVMINVKRDVIPNICSIVSFNSLLSKKNVAFKIKHALKVINIEVQSTATF